MDPEAEPVRRAAMLQGWRQLTFLHWRYPAAVVQAQVPQPLQVETFDGSAWIGLVPFYIHDLRPPLLPSLPWISHFAETNLRTYVRAPDGSRGVWFFSLDAARAPAVAGGRTLYGLPYMWSRMRVTAEDGLVRYRSERRWPDRASTTRITVRPGGPIAAAELERFLTARFRLFSFLAGKLTYTAIAHPTWPLHAAAVTDLEQTLTRAVGLPDPVGNPLVHYSPDVMVRVALPKLV